MRCGNYSRCGPIYLPGSLKVFESPRPGLYRVSGDQGVPVQLVEGEPLVRDCRQNAGQPDILEMSDRPETYPLEAHGDLPVDRSLKSLRSEIGKVNALVIQAKAAAAG